MVFRPTIKEIIIINELTLLKSACFGEAQADIYKKGDEPYMTAEQLGNCLGYSHPRENINKIVQRNPYLKEGDFSCEVKMTSESGAKNTRIFNEDGIYEITFLAKTDKAREFRNWVRELLKSLRKGELQLSKDNVTLAPEVVEAVIQKYLPRFNPMPLNTWKKYVAKPLITAIQEQYHLESKQCYELVYSQMTYKFGFNSAFAIMQFCDKYSIESVFVIDAIAESPVYQQQFVSAANQLLEKNVPLSPKRTTFTVKDSVDEIVSSVADFRNDTTKTLLSTYKLIYSKMNTPHGWKCAMSRHRKHTKKSLIESVPNQKKKFVDVCNEILLENNK